MRIDSKKLCKNPSKGVPTCLRGDPQNREGSHKLDMPASGQMVEGKKNKLMIRQPILCWMVKATRMPLSMEKWLTNNNGGRQNFRNNNPDQ